MDLTRRYEHWSPVTDDPGLIVLTVDDEAPALDEIAYLLRQDPRVATVLTATDAAGALAVLQPDGTTPVPHAVLLDIRMPGWDGVDLARVLANLPSPPVVAFLSAHDDRAVSAYEIGAVDYLLKPVRAARLAEAVGRMIAARDRELFGGPAGGAAGTAGPGTPVAAGPSAGRGDSADPMIAIDLGGTTTFVARSTVCWAEAQGDYARLHTTAGGAGSLLRTPLTTLQEEWRSAGFVRVHRGYLVDLARISELRAVNGGYRITVTGGPTPADLPVSRRHLRDLKDRLLAGRRPGR